MRRRHTRHPGPLRVVAVDHTASLGGGELALLRLCQVLDPAVVELCVVLLDDGPLVARLRECSVPVVVVQTSDIFRSADRHTAPVSALGLRVVREGMRLLRGVMSAVRAADADVIYTNSLRADLIGIVAGKLLGLPVVWHVHDRIAPDYLPVRMVRLLRQGARWGPQAVVANSEATAVTLPGVADVTVAHPGFASEQALGAFDERVPPPPSGPVVGLIGRLSPTKGQLELVRAARIVVDRVPGVRVRLIGGALFGAEGYAQEVEEEIVRLGLQDTVELWGFTDDPAAALDAFTVCVHASPVPEPFGQVVVEAMVRGVPVIATNAGGVPEIIRTDSEELGLLVTPGDVDALASAVLEVLYEPQAAQTRARRAYEVALRRFPVERTGQTLTDVWTRSVGHRG